MFSPHVLSQWIPGPLGGSTESGTRVIVDPTLSPERSVSLLRLEDGTSLLSLTPARAGELAVADGERVEAAVLVERLASAGITLNDPDHLHYLPLEEQGVLREESPGAQTRQLCVADAALFEEFTGACPEDDLDEAFVELDHWLVVGTIIAGRLVSAASMYPWGTTQLADLGVITRPDVRGRGLGRATVRAISAEALGRGFEPQYRCQVDNTASLALAEASGFSRFGQWEVILPSA